MSKFTKQEMFEILSTKNEQERKEWLLSLPQQDLIDAMNMMAEVAENIPQLMADKDFANKTTDLKIDAGLLQNMLIDEQVDKMMEEIEFQAKMKEADEAYQNLRTELIKHIVQNPTDAGSINIAKQFIEAEKNNQDYYQDENWKSILHLLK